MANKYKVARKVPSLPNGSKCVVCGADMSGKAGWIGVVDTPSGDLYEVICEKDYDAMQAEDAAAAEKPSPPAAPATAPSPAPAVPKDEPKPAEQLMDAMKAFISATAAANAPKADPVDEQKLLQSAKDAAAEAVRAEMRKTVLDIIKTGTVSAPDADDSAAAEKPKPAAKNDGVKAAEKASSWAAKATPTATSAVEKLEKFLSEFSFFRCGISMRLVNTFRRAADKAAALRSYCEVSQMEDLPDLIEKMKSPEFAEVVKAFAATKNPDPTNRRFAVFYGAPGGGKTYAAEMAAKDVNGDGEADVVPCSPSMDAADTLYAYRLDYKSGRSGYIPTALLNAMEQGRCVVLDEVNLLPMEARMFLQNVLDNKREIHVMGQKIVIKDGFFVIGTMNVETGNGVQPLPLPLTDRAAVVREFRATTAQLAVGAGLC